MKEQKLIITESEKEINDWLDRGWEIVSVTAQHVSTAWCVKISGKFAIVIQKQ
jgi:hypothetical protein